MNLTQCKYVTMQILWYRLTKDSYKMRQFLNAALSGFYVSSNVLVEGAEFIVFQIFMLYLVSPLRTLISSFQPLTSLSSVTHLSPISYLYLHPFFTIAFLSLSPINLTPGPFAPLLFDVSLIPPRLSTLVFSSIFQRYPLSRPHFSHFQCPPFLPVRLFLWSPSTSKSFSLFLSLLFFLKYVIFYTSWHHPSLTDPVSIPFPPISLFFPLCPPCVWED